jgi:hypothetical protein
MEPRQQQFSLLYVLAEVLMMLAIQSYIGTSHGETLPMLQSGFAADFVLSMAVESLNGVRNRSTAAGAVREADPAFQQAIALLRDVQAAGAFGTGDYALWIVKLALSQLFFRLCDDSIANTTSMPPRIETFFRMWLSWFAKSAGSARQNQWKIRVVGTRNSARTSAPHRAFQPETRVRPPPISITMVSTSSRLGSGSSALEIHAE